MAYVEKEAVLAYLHRPDSATWEDPDWSLLNGHAEAAPTIPIELFGTWAGWLKSFAASVCAPVDYAALALLASAGACIGASRRAWAWGSFREYPTLWALLVGDPSAAKTPVFSPFISAIRAIERAEAIDLPERKRQWETEKLVADERTRAWEKNVADAVKQGNPAPYKGADMEAPDEPKPPRIVVSDATIESLAPLFRSNPRGLLLARDELAGWIGNFGKYGGDGDAAFFLERYTGQPITTDRVRAGNVTAARGLLSVFGSIQPERLTDLLLRRSDDGFVARFLVVLPDPVPRRRPTEAVDMDLLQSAFERLRGLRMAESDDGELVPRDLPLDPEAVELFTAWWQENGDQIRASSGFSAGFLGKGAGIVLRLALILELLQWAAAPGGDDPKAISAKTTLAACALFDDYFVQMAARVYGAADRFPADMLATAVLRRLRGDQRAAINATWLRRHGRVPGLKKAEDVESVIKALSDGGWLRFVGSREGSTPGRLKQDYEVNPKLWGSA